MTPEVTAWLNGTSHEVAGWAPDPPPDALHCERPLVTRLSEAGRTAAPAMARVWVDGCPVLHHPNGAPVACAWGACSLVVRSAQAPGALTPASTTPGLDDTWVDLDPWAVDTTFARTSDLLRMHVRRAYELAEARAWH